MPRFENFNQEAEQVEFTPTGELDLDIAKLTDEQRIVKAVSMVLDSVHYDGEHHKQWTLDQVLRILTGEEYENVIAKFETGEDGTQAYEWDTGVAP